MRRFSCIALFLTLTLCLSGCGSGKTVVVKDSADKAPPESLADSASKEAAPLELDQKNTVADWADFTLAKVETTNRIEGSLTGGTYYENENQGETYIDVVIDITNTTSGEMRSDDIITLTAVSSSGTEYEGTLNAVETDGGKYVSAFEPLKPLATVRMHCAVSVPDGEDTFTLTLQAGESAFTCDYTLGETLVHATPLTVGTKLESDEYAEIVFQGASYTDDLLPSNTSGFYTHYAVDSPDSTYLAVRLDITNLQSTAKEADTFVGTRACFMEKYTYTGFLVVEDTDGTGFSAYESIAPLATRHAVVLIEVPKTVMNEPAVVTVNFNGQEYTYEIAQ